MRSPDWKGRSWIPYCWAISIFACSRLVVALGLVFSQKYLTSSIERWSAGPLWYHQLLQWDSEWYFKIVKDGYQYNGDPTVQQNIVFYPLFPMLARGLGDNWWCCACGCDAVGVERRGIARDRHAFQAGSRGIWRSTRSRHNRAAQLFSRFGLAVGGVYRARGTAADRLVFSCLETKILLVGSTACRPRSRHPINGHCPFACPSLGDVAQSRSEAVSSCSPAMRRSCDIRHLAIHDLSLERFRKSVCFCGWADGLS